MDIIEVGMKIQEKIKESELARSLIRERATEKAKTKVAYDKAMAKAIIILKADGQPVSIIDKLAKAECSEEMLAAETADAMYKSVITNLNAICAELNGWQSIYRHLDNA